MIQYRSAVQSYARNGIDYLFHNKGSEHALIILSNIFQNAQDTVRIAANKLFNDEVVNTHEYIASMESFLSKKDSRLQIIIEQKPTKDEVLKHGKENTFYWMLFNHPAYRQGRVEIREGQGKSFKDPNGNKVNFCTGDNVMFRLENDVIERKAVANFHDPDFTAQLVDVFDQAFASIPSTVDLSEYYCNQ